MAETSVPECYTGLLPKLPKNGGMPELHDLLTDEKISGLLTLQPMEARIFLRPVPGYRVVFADAGHFVIR